MSSFFNVRPYVNVILATFLILIATVCAEAQPSGSSEDASAGNPAVRRIERARALAAVHQLQAAAVELENIRASVNDIALRNVTTLMLLGIYLEEGNYGRSQSLLEETFQQRAAQKDESLRTYFAAAGQTLNGVRAHLARYRSFGLNPSERGLPVEANTDLERLRTLLEHVIAQANEIAKEAGRSYEALALLEDVLNIRLSLARHNDDRTKWQAQYNLAREKMASTQIQVASLGRSRALDALTNRVPNPFANPTTSDATSDSSPEPSPSPAAATTGPEPQLVSTGSLSGRETKRVTPVYPPAAKSNGIYGTVRVFAIVDENGKIWVTNSEGPMMLRRAAEEAAKGWTFPPSLVNSRPVRLAGYLDFEFKL